MARKKKTVSYQTAASERAKRDKYFQFISLIGFFILWQLFGYINEQMLWIQPKFLPTPLQIVMAAVSYLQAGTLWTHLSVSLWRVLVGYLIGVLIAVVLGSLIACFKPIDNIITPILNLFGPIPIMAFLPIFILWFGIGERSKLVLIAYATVIYIISYVTEGIKNTDSVLIRSAISLGSTPWQLFWNVRFQSAFPNIFLGMKGALGAAFSAMVVAEMMGASTGLGYIIVFSKNWFKMADMFMAAIIIGLMYSVLFAILTFFEHRLFKWKLMSIGSAIES